MQLILYSRDDCPLCDRLEALLRPQLETLSKRISEPVELVKRNILDDPQWFEAYRFRIPVLTFKQRVLIEGRSAEDQIRGVLQELY